MQIIDRLDLGNPVIDRLVGYVVCHGEGVVNYQLLYNIAGLPGAFQLRHDSQIH